MSSSGLYFNRDLLGGSPVSFEKEGFLKAGVLLVSVAGQEITSSTMIDELPSASAKVRLVGNCQVNIINMATSSPLMASCDDEPEAQI